MTEENKQILSKTNESKAALQPHSANALREQSPLMTTGKKEKDPRKVEAGKRLAQIFREAKERKKKKKLEASKEANQETSSFIFLLQLL